MAKGASNFGRSTKSIRSLGRGRLGSALPLQEGQYLSQACCVNAWTNGLSLAAPFRPSSVPLEFTRMGATKKKLPTFMDSVSRRSHALCVHCNVGYARQFRSSCISQRVRREQSEARRRFCAFPSIMAAIDGTRFPIKRNPGGPVPQSCLVAASVIFRTTFYTLPLFLQPLQVSPFCWPYNLKLFVICPPRTTFCCVNGVVIRLIFE